MTQFTDEHLPRFYPVPLANLLAITYNNYQPPFGLIMFVQAVDGGRPITTRARFLLTSYAMFLSKNKHNYRRSIGAVCRAGWMKNPGVFPGDFTADFERNNINKTNIFLLDDCDNLFFLCCRFVCGVSGNEFKLIIDLTVMP